MLFINADNTARFIEDALFVDNDRFLLVANKTTAQERLLMMMNYAGISSNWTIKLGFPDKS